MWYLFQALRTVLQFPGGMGCDILKTGHVILFLGCIPGLGPEGGWHHVVVVPTEISLTSPMAMFLLWSALTPALSSSGELVPRCGLLLEG